MDADSLFAKTMKKKLDDAKPRTILAVVDSELQGTQSDARVFRLRAIRQDNQQPVYLIIQQRSENQNLPAKGDIIRADKASLHKMNGDTPQYIAEYFHAYKNGLCMNAVMQPGPVYNDRNMLSAQVYAFDPKMAGVNLSADKAKEQLVDAIVSQLMPWRFKQGGDITHDVAGRPLWKETGLSGARPMAVVRYAQSHTFKVFGIGGVFKDQNNRALGMRLPTVDELRQQVGKNPAVQKILTTLDECKRDPQWTDEKLKSVRLSVLPGLCLEVGRDLVNKAEKAGRSYFKVPLAYVLNKAEPNAMKGFRQSFLHVKETRAGRMVVVDTVPAPGGTLSAQVPLFQNETARWPSASAAGTNSPEASKPLSRAEMGAAAFGDAPAGAAATAQTAGDMAAPAGFEAGDLQAFGDDAYDYDALSADMGRMEELSQHLDDWEIDTLLKQAEQHADGSPERTNSPGAGPRMG